MVVVVILALLAGLVAPRIFANVEKANVQTAQTQIRLLRSALETYRLEVGSFPTARQGLGALIQAPADAERHWQGPYLGDEVPLDPWHQAYVYEGPADTLQGFVLYSLGADGTKGGDGYDADIGYFNDTKG